MLSDDHLTGHDARFGFPEVVYQFTVHQELVQSSLWHSDCPLTDIIDELNQVLAIHLGAIDRR